MGAYPGEEGSHQGGIPEGASQEEAASALAPDVMESALPRACKSPKHVGSRKAHRGRQMTKNYLMFNHLPREEAFLVGPCLEGGSHQEGTLGACPSGVACLEEACRDEALQTRKSYTVEASADPLD